MKYISTSLKSTQKIANEVIGSISTYSDAKGSGATVVGLYGDLGAGKTSFTQGLAKAFGVEESVVSPTFVIEKIYEVGVAGRPFFHFIHIDAYRLEDSRELLNLGWEKILKDNSNIIVIEWPEKVIDIMPEHMKITLKALDNPDHRSIEIDIPKVV
jgi:tRNA threonylcarbamoyladenosine biosynthesis protein TsaE